MVYRLASLCSILLFGSLVSTQNFNIRHATLQDMIDYTSQFHKQHNAAFQQPAVDPIETGKLEDDPFVRNLFQEFLVQYQQLAKEQTTTEAPITTTTPPPLLFPNFPETTPTSQKRRISSKRKMNAPHTAQSPLTSTATSTLLDRVNSLHQESTESTESTTSFPSLKQKFFGIGTFKKPSSTTPNPLSIIFKNTPTPPAVAEQPSTSTPPPKSSPNFKIPQRLAGLPSKSPITSSKVETATKKIVESKFDEEEFRRQAESAKYEFASEIDDEINGNSHQREEVRDGLAVKGRYSYSDGYFKRTIHYEADDKGYRVTKEEVEPLEGPQANPDGQARVSSYVAGNTLNYHITKDDILMRNQKAIFAEAPSDDDVVEDQN